MVKAAITFLAFALTITSPCFAAERVVRPQKTHLSDFEIFDVTGTLLKTEELRNKKPLLIYIHNFTRGFNEDRASAKEIELMNAVVERFAGKLVVLDIITESKTPRPDIIELYEQKGATYTPAVDEDGKILKHLEAKEIPCFLIYDRNGRVKGIWPPQHLTKELLLSRLSAAIGVSE